MSEHGLAGDVAERHRLVQGATGLVPVVDVGAEPCAGARRGTGRGARGGGRGVVVVDGEVLSLASSGAAPRPCGRRRRRPRRPRAPPPSRSGPPGAGAAGAAGAPCAAPSPAPPSGCSSTLSPFLQVGRHDGAARGLRKPNVGRSGGRFEGMGRGDVRDHRRRDRRIAHGRPGRGPRRERPHRPGTNSTSSTVYRPGPQARRPRPAGPRSGRPVVGEPRGRGPGRRC